MVLETQIMVAAIVASAAVRPALSLGPKLPFLGIGYGLYWLFGAVVARRTDILGFPYVGRGRLSWRPLYLWLLIGFAGDAAPKPHSEDVRPRWCGYGSPHRPARAPGARPAPSGVGKLEHTVTPARSAGGTIKTGQALFKTRRVR